MKKKRVKNSLWVYAKYRTIGGTLYSAIINNKRICFLEKKDKFYTKKFSRGTRDPHDVIRPFVNYEVLKHSSSRSFRRLWFNDHMSRQDRRQFQRILNILLQKKNTIYKKKSELDQFYTSEKIAKYCYNKIFEFFNQGDFEKFLEPSAGSGAFFELFPKGKRDGVDLEPKHPEVIKMDFFDYPAPDVKTITIGNPPFGKNSSLAVKFFNKAASFSDVIAFIIPKTFKKQSLQNKLNLSFHLVHSEDLPKNSFVLNGKPYDVPCCFQIWERKKTKRKIVIAELAEPLFEFVDKKSANMAIRRVGGRAGEATDDVSVNENTYYFLNYTADSPTKEQFIKSINSIDFSDVVNNTAGIRSLSKQELILLINRHILKV